MSDESSTKVYNEIVSEIRGSLIEAKHEETLASQSISYKIFPGSKANEAMLREVEAQARKEATIRGAALIAAVGILSSLRHRVKRNSCNAKISAELDLLFSFLEMYVKLYRDHSVITLTQWREAMMKSCFSHLQLFCKVPAERIMRNISTEEVSSLFLSDCKKSTDAGLLYDIVSGCYCACNTKDESATSEKCAVETATMHIPMAEDQENGSSAENHLKLVLKRTLQIGRKQLSRAPRTLRKRLAADTSKEKQKLSASDDGNIDDDNLHWKEMEESLYLYISEQSDLEW